ncbi:MAG: hypothetical protein KGJ03_01585 [Betaproteobacteria bacterium]|nr:hypothetical protein [Betaproteobacteria bacterium]MBU6511503.1 hypothetical protein [Betaproteobacteria bacterium]MDE1954388.1 hypothetical protein [Betaproteobacteria bacterium]MDE2151079.1 hypothetical protein [Betaproteobacteria bacterium]MDE2478282.1 hypothetical protein [Betaproteobacteria bacterium]
MTRHWKISALALLLGGALFTAAQAEEPYWSLSVGTPGLAANVGNVLPAPPVVYAAPPVVYAPAPVYYAPAYAAPPAYGWRRGHRWHRDDDDERWGHDR